ncbi:MAG: AmmeMemoRadiSam system radical SAM enzyme [Candidatus Bathyarchaeota archaeon]|nr:MAG: AmmeMemoRadiSam system radical SAM enzyme [Candidatus Bathyarchaeum tardum]WNZ28979.1 MAG: AmmeMemoRadiSam system radical SAM enzyme [Candidatus Bathyarchaeota archaeon]
MKEAMFYEKLADKRVNCNLCSHRCRKIAESKRGLCGVRENIDGKLFSLVYGRLVARSVDPIEKKPLFHFLPGSLSYSISTVGCNFRCANCQNFDISQLPSERKVVVGNETSPESVISAAKENGCKSIAYTYTEPTIFFEYALDVAKLAKKAGLRNVFVTNGYITEEALREIAPYLDAANIDLKSFSDEFYRNNCGAHLQPVLDSIKLHKSLGIWVELTTLVIPTLNDSENELNQIASFIKEKVGAETPWHLSGFHPMYKLLDVPRTPVVTLQKARQIGFDAGLKYVYVGNVPGENGENTYCPNCGEKVIQRYGCHIEKNKVVQSKCPQCEKKIDGVFA